MTTENPVRVPPLAADELNSEQRALVGEWTTLNFSTVLVRHPSLYRSFLPFIDQTIRGSILPAREREILIMRTLAIGQDVYESYHHTSIALKSGMTAAEIESARGNGELLTPFERILVRAADELVGAHRLSDTTWETLSERYSPEQRMELIFLVGCYSTMAMATRSLGIEVEAAEVHTRLAELRQYT
jgi:4-carboxymuconolactone decarboxylase